MDRFFALCVVGSAFILGVSFYAEYGLEKQPCLLCNIQRISWGFILLFGMCGLFLKSQKANLIRCTQLFAILGIFVASYHLAVIADLIEDRCVHNTKPTSMKFYQEMLLSPNKSTTQCKSTWRPLNIPAPIWNLISLASILGFSLKRHPSTA